MSDAGNRPDEYEPAPGGPTEPPDGPPTSTSSQLKRWMPAIGLGVVFLLGLVALFITMGDDDGDGDGTTTTASTTSSSVATTPTTAPTTGAAPTTAAPTTAALTTAAPTTAAPTTATTTGGSGDANAALIADCIDGNPFACYDVGAKGLPAPGGINPNDRWAQASDQAVADACGQGDLGACWESGVRGLPIGD